MIHSRRRIAKNSSLLFLALLLVIAGCAPQQLPAKDPFFEEWKTRAETSQPFLPSRQGFEESSPGKQLQKELAEATPTHQSLEEQRQEFVDSLPTDKISVRFVNDDLATSLRTLGRLAQQNILLSPNVKGTVNLDIRETAWDQVFMAIINSYGLTVTREGNLLHVMSIGDLKQQVERKALQLEEDQVSPLTTRIVPVEFSSPETIATSVALLLSQDKEGKPRGSVSVDQHARALIVRDTEEHINNLLKLIYDLDKPTPQILIKAHIVETTKDTARELGIQWGALSSNVLGDAGARLYPGGSTTFDSAGNAISYAPAALGKNVDLAAGSISGVNSAAASIGLLINGSDLLLDAQLSALQHDGKLNILSSPSIATLDNSEAIIESGKDVPFQTIQGDGSFTIEYRAATLKLTVTPHVISETMIKLNIEAKKDEVESSGGSNPTIIKKLAKTQLIVQNGATVVIAGLSKETHADNNTGVPGAKDVPLFGRLFRKDSTRQEFEELLLFITPTILTKTAGTQ